MSIQARACDAPNSGGRTPGSKLPASPPPLPRPDGGGTLAVYLCTRPKKAFPSHHEMQLQRTPQCSARLDSMTLLHVMVADVIKSFDTVDRSILDCTLGRLGLPDWFRKVYFSFHSQVRLRFKLAAGLGEPWCRDGGIPQGCPLSMIFIVALYVPWCLHLESLPGVKPQHYDDNLKCSAARPRALFESAHFTAQYVRSVGQDVSPW